MIAKFNILSEIFIVRVTVPFPPKKKSSYHSKWGGSKKKCKRGKNFSQWRLLDEAWECLDERVRPIW